MNTEVPTVQVIADVTVSLDGYIAGRNDGPDNGLGDGGSVLHEWMWNGSDPEGASLVRTAMERVGSVVMGNRTFRNIDNPKGWRAPDGSTFRTPVFVVRHAATPPVTKGETPFTFVTAGIEAAVAGARRASAGKAVSLMGGTVIRQALAAGLLDELCVHVVSVLLGGGVALFSVRSGGPIRLERLRSSDTHGATHLWYRVVRKEEHT